MHRVKLASIEAAQNNQLQIINMNILNMKAYKESVRTEPFIGHNK